MSTAGEGVTPRIRVGNDIRRTDEQSGVHAYGDQSDAGWSSSATKGSRGVVVKVLDSKFEGCEFKTHTGHGSFSKLRQFRLPYFASVYSAENEYKHCLEGTCDGLVSRPGESV